jgi:hypothetical protein
MTRKILMIALVLGSVACKSAPPPGYVSSAEFGAKWPLTVSEGVLECTTHPSGFSVPVKAVTFKTNDGRVYAVNGAAKGRGSLEIEPIWKLAPVSYDKPSTRLSESERKAIFAESVECEDESDKKATAKYEKNLKNRKRWADLQQKLDDECKAALKKRRKLTDKEHDAMAEEGVSLGWPPFDPPRVSINPLIQRGLKLCGS